MSKKLGQTIIYIFILGIFYTFTGTVLFIFYFTEVNKINPDATAKEIINLIFNRSYFIGLLLFTITYLNKIFHYIRKKEFLDDTSGEIARIPFIRVWILLMIVLCGVFLFRSTSVYLLIGFMILKTWLDVILIKKIK